MSAWDLVILAIAAWIAFNVGYAAALWLVRCHIPDRRAARDLDTIRGCWDASAQWHERHPGGL